MAQSTGPVLAAVGIVIGNNVLTQHVNLADEQRIVVGGIITAIGLSALERIAPGAAVTLAWLIVVGVTVVRINPNQPSPLESLLAWYSGTGK